MKNLRIEFKSTMTQGDIVNDFPKVVPVDIDFNSVLSIGVASIEMGEKITAHISLDRDIDWVTERSLFVLGFKGVITDVIDKPKFKITTLSVCKSVIRSGDKIHEEIAE